MEANIFSLLSTLKQSFRKWMSNPFPHSILLPSPSNALNVRSYRRAGRLARRGTCSCLPLPSAASVRLLLVVLCAAGLCLPGSVLGTASSTGEKPTILIDQESAGRHPCFCDPFLRPVTCSSRQITRRLFPSYPRGLHSRRSSLAHAHECGLFLEA